MAIKPSICIDIDNVIARTDDILREVIRCHSKAHVDLCYADVVAFDYWQCVDRHGHSFSKADWQDIHLEFTQNHLHKVQPFDRIREHLLDLSEKFELHMVTSRLPEGHEATRTWLLEHRLPFSYLHFSGHRMKHHMIEPFLAAIEDDREQAELFQNRGVHAFLLAHPWNVLAPGSRITRVQNWLELVTRLKAIS